MSQQNKGHGMQLLIKIQTDAGEVAHIANAQGKPLCRVTIKLALWRLAEAQLGQRGICQNCRRIWDQQQKYPLTTE